MEKTKTPTRKSKTATITYFGSDDMNDLPSEKDYKNLLALSQTYSPDNIKSLPMTISGDKAIKLITETVVMAEGDRFKFVAAKTKRAPKSLEDDAFTKRAATQLDLFLREGKPRIVIAPYYVRLVRD